MIACYDVHYDGNQAYAAAITFSRWTDTDPAEIWTLGIPSVGNYESGRFYRRELAPLLAIVKKIPAPIDFHIIDAWCHLSNTGAPGLGWYLHQSLPANSVVIGVAKNPFGDTNHAVEIYRGNSDRPLYITSIGIKYDDAARFIQSMAGAHRIPTLLKLVDRISKSGK